MKEFLAHFFSQQTPPPGSREGLPYWTLWLLLCVILLLVSFIFLRDKDLRRRLNLFFFGAKKKLIKIRLQARLKREYRKKDEFVKGLGKKVWEDEIIIPKEEKIRHELTKLQQNREDLERESEDTQSKISTLESQLGKFIQKHKEIVNEQEMAKKPYKERLGIIKEEEKLLEIQIIQKQKELEGIIRGINAAKKEIYDLEEQANLDQTQKQDKPDKINSNIQEQMKQKDEADENIKALVEKKLTLEKEWKDHQEKIEELDEKLKKIEEDAKKKSKEFEKEIKEWRKNREKLQEKIEHTEKKKDPLFERLGSKADEMRVNREELSLFYSQIDRANERIEELEQQIKDL